MFVFAATSTDHDAPTISTLPATSEFIQLASTQATSTPCKVFNNIKLYRLRRYFSYSTELAYSILY